jgi:hypothetical protein
MDLVNLASHGHASPTAVIGSVIGSLVFVVIIGGSIYAATKAGKWRAYSRPKFDGPALTGTAVNWNAGQPSTPGEPTRFWLAPNPYQNWLGVAPRGCYPLALDVGKDAMWMIDWPASNALIASAWRAQVTATPALSDDRYRTTGMPVPVLVVQVPGAPDVFNHLIIGPRNYGYDALVRRGWGFVWRYSWSVAVPREKKSPTHLVTGAQWFALVETFGLAPYLEDLARR